MYGKYEINLQIIANATIKIEDDAKEPSNSLKAYSATPLPPGVGLTSMNNHIINCFPII